MGDWNSPAKLFKSALTLLFSSDNGYLFLSISDQAKGNQDEYRKNVLSVSDTYKSGGLGMRITAGGNG